MNKTTFILLMVFFQGLFTNAQQCNTGTLDPQVALLLKNAIHDLGAALPTIPPEIIRKERLSMDSTYPAGDLRRIRVGADSVSLSVFNTAHGKGLPVIIYYHLGGFAFPLLPAMEKDCWKMSEEYHAIVFAVDYRILPEYKYPAALNDAYTAFRWIAEHAGEYGGDVTKIVLIGESSGGNLATVVCQKAKKDAMAGRIKLQVLISPPVDDARNYATHPSYQRYATGYFLTREFMLFSQKLYASEKDLSNPEVSPLLAADFSEMPPVLMITTEFDVLHDEDDLYVERLRKAGVKVLYKCMPGQIHCLVGLSPEAAAYKDVKSLMLTAIRESVR